MKTFIINLEKDTERKKYIVSQCMTFNLDCTVIPAVDGRKLSEDDLNKLIDPEKSRGMTRGEIGCSLSHYNIYKKIVDDNIQHALILEDDARLEPNIHNALKILEKNISEAPTIVLLGPINKYSTLDSKQVSDEFKMVNVLEAALSHGYVINISAAKKLIKFLYPIWLEADRWVFFRDYNVVDVKALVPPSITLSTLSNTSTIWPTEEELLQRGHIENERSSTLKKIKRERKIMIKIRLFFWRNITRKLIGVTSND